MKETAVNDHVRLAAAQNNVDLWRNNVGAVHTDDGRFIRFGLCNESKKQNELIKSSDLVGITPVLITPDMVGQVVGVFTAVETKKSNWNFSLSDKRAVAQKAFHDIVLRAGGYAGFAKTVEDFKRIIKR